MDRTTRLVTLTLLTALVAACGGGSGSPAPAPVPVPSPPPPPPAPTVAQRAAAAASAASQAADCVAVRPFYWSVGDAGGKLGDGNVGAAPPVASTIMAIASASKLVYGAYVAQQRGGVLTDTDLHDLNFVSGYTDFTSCQPGETVGTCESDGTNGTYEAANDGKFFYGGGHMEKHANDNGLATFGNADLASAINASLGTSFNYSQPQLAGGIYTSATDYGAFLQRIVAGQLEISALLGAHPVCTQPSTCATAVYTPIPSEADHYSIGHWVEDDPAAGDGAFSSPGAFGFYPWIAHDKAWWGVLARSAKSSDEQEGVASMKCGRKIRAAWVAGQYP
ncbi:hypothetical protein [Scleromatobacter humisilvae]|uniref:Beta-lactamase-related domain-containing protein n=1 Tax=Scleromatobacter humisilvae TaxID=2897159 RepID=A0A9X1YHR0_9BURK|nr:hypothetical protein [Scleromatobacter humisilvae]MCK9684622.1 hypothetical protein [Scleromatobacter humisilvae]